MAPEICPHCGAEVPANAIACPECGSDETTGWSQAAVATRLNLPDDHFDYNEFVAEEFAEKSPKPRGLAWFWWMMAIVILVILCVMFVRL